jgi:DNA-binding beta-propeller fold protein YncE
MIRRIGEWKIGIVLLLGAAAVLVPGSRAADEKYPHVNAAVGFAVDSSWPSRPSGVQWGETSGIAVDKQDRVYVFTRAKPPIQVYDTQGHFVRSWGEDVIKSAHHIKIDTEGNVWVADVGNHTIMKFTPEGKLLRTLGTKGAPGRDQSHFDKPTDMAITPAGDVFVSDGYGNARIVHFDKDGKFVKEWGEPGTKPGQFSIPHAICVDSKGRLYVADRNNVRIQIFDQAGKLLDTWSNVMVPWGFCVTPEDEIWVCGSSPMRWRKEDNALGCPPKDQVFMKFNPQGRLLQTWTVPKGADGLEKPGECNWVHCIAVDSRGNLYVGDIIGKRAQKFVRQDKD